MRISKQVSGNAAQRDVEERQGRGEYEWCGLTDYDPTQAELLNRRVFLTLPGAIRLDTQCVLGWDEKTQKKNRIRNDDDAAGVRHNYPPYHLAAALMLPLPTRMEQNWGEGLPILRNEQYSFMHIFCGRIRLGDDSVAADVPAERIEVKNQYATEEYSIADRLGLVERLWSLRANLEPELSALIDQHEHMVRAGGAIAAQGKKLVRQIQVMTADRSLDYTDIAGASRVGDPLPTLLQMAGQSVPIVVIPIAEVPSEQDEIRRREIRRQRLMTSRGSQAAAFRRRVRAAYKSTCLVCGLCLPAPAPGGNPGVDAAHILPYREFDLERLSNGVCLCKLHHWAFDEGLIEIRCESGVYSIAVPDEAKEIVQRSGLDLSFLNAVIGPAPRSRLPRITADRPDPQYLLRLREMFYPPD